MPQGTRPPPPRRSRVRRFLRGCVVLGIAGCAVVAGLAGWLWSNRVEYLNRSLASLGPLRGSAVDFTLTRGGAVLRGFELRDGRTDSLLLRLPEIVVRFAPGEIRRRHLRLVTLNDAEISLTEPILAQWLDQSAGGESAGSTTLPGGWSIGRVELRRARLRYTERDGTREEIVADFDAAGVSTNSGGILSVGQQELKITAGAVARGERAPLTLEALHASGQVHDGQILLDELSIEKPALALTPEFLDFLTPDSRAAAGAAEEVKPPSATRRAASFVHGLRIGRVKCDNLVFSAAGFVPGNVAGIELPEMRARLSYETTDFRWSEGEPVSPGAQRLRIDDLQLKPSEGPGGIQCRALDLVVPPSQDGRWTVEKLSLRGPVIAWTPELRRLLAPAADGKTTPPGELRSGAGKEPGPNEAGGSTWSVRLQSVELLEARVSIADAGILPFDLRGTTTLGLRELLIDAKGAHSASAQSLELKDAALSYPARQRAGPVRPFLELPRGILAIKPDAWNASEAVETLALTKPVLRLRDGNTPWFDPAPAAAAPQAAPDDAGDSFWPKLHFAQLAIEGGFLDIAAANHGRALDSQAKLTVTTDQAKPGLHRLRFENFEARLPGLTLFPFPVARASFVECVASLPEVWNSHRIESLRIGGANIEAGEALMKFFEPASAAEPIPVASPAKSKIQNPKSNPDWMVGDFGIADSAVTLDHLVPGMDSVKFEVLLEAKDVPLSPEGFAADVAPQRVELANLLIPSPFGGAPVAKLDSVFVNFSPAGLIAKRLDKVEIVSPTLFVGEPFFWYVDYYRRYAALGAPGPETKVAALDKIFAVQAAAAAIANEPPASRAGWDMGILQVHRGRLVIAPKGVPLSGFRTPFPFSFTSQVSSGTLQADFEIPEDDYEMPDLKIKFEGMSGNVQFNLPVKDRDNNLTQVFKVKRIHWKELRMEDAFLTATFDQGGIYGKFGGAAYDGYVNGEFNVYIDEVYSWDGWLNGTDVQTREITKKLFPGYFFMEGQVGATLTMNGDGKEIYQTDLKFGNRTPGRISIEALNDLIKKLPESLSGLREQLTQVALETMRDFAYERADGRLRSYGREGRGTLKFTGPMGTRSFELNAYDHRWKTDPPPDQKPSTARDGAP